jgi:prepilin-type N-terminal cleavage/methylation domain-containing protein
MKGFTLLEAVVVILILGILASLGVTQFNKSVEHNKLQKATTDLYLQLRTMKSLTMKYDNMVFVSLSNEQCSVFVDTNRSGTKDAFELSQVISFPPSITVGVALEGPNGSPGMAIPFNGDGIAGSWNPITINKGVTSTGAVYLHSSRLKKVTYCIGISSSMPAIKIYKWNGGSSWISL